MEQTDKEILIETFQKIGVNFEIDKDGDIELQGKMWLLFDENGKYTFTEFN